MAKEIKIKDFLESEGNRSTADEKSNRVDIVAEDRDGNKILIEVQNETENEYFHRILFGTSRMIMDHVKKLNPTKKFQKSTASTSSISIWETRAIMSITVSQNSWDCITDSRSCCETA